MTSSQVDAWLVDSQINLILEKCTLKDRHQLLINFTLMSVRTQTVYLWTSKTRPEPRLKGSKTETKTLQELG